MAKPCLDTARAEQVVEIATHDVTLEFYFHTNWDLRCEVLLFVSLSGRKMYFHSRSLRTSHCKFRYEIKTSYHGKCLNDFCSLVAMH